MKVFVYDDSFRDYPELYFIPAISSKDACMKWKKAHPDALVTPDSFKEISDDETGTYEYITYNDE